MRLRLRSLALLCLWALPSAQLFPATAFSQVRPDTGRILEQVAPEPTPPAHPEVNLETSDRPAIARPGGETIAVTRLRITGSTRYSADQLHELVAEAEGKTLRLEELQALAQRVTRFYRERGYLLTRAYLPAQQIEHGVVEIAVLEGRLDQVRIENSSGIKPAALAPLRKIPTGEPLSAEVLERALLLAADNPGVSIKSTLSPGSAVGTSDLLVEVAPGRRVAGSFSADTYGNRHTGSFRPGANLSVNNPLNMGDQLTVGALLSLEDLYHLRAGYQLPVTRWGTRAGISYAWLDYALAGDFAALDAEGDARIASAHLQQPLVRSRRFNLYGQLQHDRKQLEDRLGAFDTATDKRLRNWTLGLTGDFADLGEHGANSFSLRYTRGELDLDPLSRAQDAVSAHSQGHFGKWNLSYQRLQSFTPAFGLFISYEGQLADGNLDSAEKTSLGGAYGVRAYPQGEAPADEAHLLTLELRWRVPLDLPGNWQLTSFVDHGRARLNDAPWVSGEENHRELTGAGIGLNLSASARWSLKTSLAWRVDGGPPASGGDKSPRAWLYGATYF